MPKPHPRSQAFVIHGRRIVFSLAALERLRRRQRSVWQGLRRSPWPNLLVAPIVYAGIVPLALLDAFVSFYQWSCFPIFGIAQARRGDYFSMDRGQLPYLNWVEKLNCDYCAYGNGILAFAREVASLTEQYFCPIRHAIQPKGANDRDCGFLPYGDGRDFHKRLARLQKELKAPRF